MHPQVTFRQLRYFIAVAESRSFRKAAELLNMSQPPLTQQIQQLEREVGTQLLDRDKRQVRVTAAGAELLSEARAILDRLNKGIAHSRATGQGLVGRLRIGLTDDFIYSPVLSRIIDFIHHNPDIVIELHVETSPVLLSELCGDALDLILTNTPVSPASVPLVKLRLESSAIVVVMPKSHRLASRKVMHVRDLADEPLIHLPDSSTLPFSLECARLFLEAEIVPIVAYRTTNALVGLRLASEGLGIALASEHSVSMLPSHLIALPLRTRARLNHALLYQDRPLSPALSRLTAALKHDHATLGVLDGD